MNPSSAYAELVTLLQMAYSGERAAAFVYLGHRRSLRRPKRADDREMLRLVLVDDRGVLSGRWLVRTTYGAGKLERDNIVGYEVAARLAHLAGHSDLVDQLLELAEVEWDHKRLFRTAASSHLLWKLSPKWPETTPRAQIRSCCETFLAGDEPESKLRWNPLR